MANKLNYDTDNRVIYVTQAPTNGLLTLDAKTDIYSAMKSDWKTNSALSKFRFPLSEPVGGNPVSATKKISPYYFVKYGWTFRPYEADHTVNLENGYLSVAGGGDAWIPTIGAYTVKIRDIVPSDSITEVVVTGSGVTQEDIDAITAGVWDEAAANIIENQIAELHKLRGLLSGKPVTHKQGSIDVDGIKINVSGDENETILNRET